MESTELKLLFLVQFKPTNALIYIRITIMLYNTNNYIFRTLCALHHGVQNCIKQFLKVFISCIWQNYWKFLKVYYICSYVQ